uniref:Uncharacterized protein n=1 Tax=viral metagenome TaxID=1070528 RepID=A0A6C0J3W0_9ZZZZ
MSKPLSTFVQTLVDDPAFVDSIEDNIKNIMADGKVTMADMPEIIEMATNCYNNLSKVHLTYEELPDVLKEIICYILNKYELVPEEEEKQFMKMIDTGINLIMLSPKVKKCCLSVWNKLSCKGKKQQKK